LQRRRPAELGDILAARGVRARRHPEELPMADIKLTYFDFAASRGEECRIALHVAGVPFEDERLPRDAWPTLKPTTPYGSLPILTVAGKGVLAEANAILGWVGRNYGLHPTDAWEAARHEAILSACETLRHKVNDVLRVKGDPERKQAREEMASGLLPTWGERFERQIEGPFVSGDRLNVADIKLFMIVGWFAKGVIDHVPTDVFAGFPKLTALYEAVARDEKVASWTTKR
jgi:glutathione S-transferase